MHVSDRFEYVTEQDSYRNYCLWPYVPVNRAVDKFRSLNLLYHAFDVAGMDERVFDFVEAIRDGIGSFRTVWGTKLIKDRLAWEFYFYDYGRRERKISISRLIEILAPFTLCSVSVNENINYFMFSFDVDQELITSARPLDVVHMYLGNAGSTVSSGISYALRQQSSSLENLYYFFEVPAMLQQVMDKVGDSAYVDETAIPMDSLVWPELRECRTICVANKQHNDTIYFAGINVDQLLLFFSRTGYPTEIIDFVRTNRADLDHLLYDVGYDYRTTGNEVEIIKSGYYGVF